MQEQELCILQTHHTTESGGDQAEVEPGMQEDNLVMHVFSES